MTLPQFDLMAQLDRVPDGLTMSALSERLMVSNGNVTGIVARLVADRLVERQAAKTDRRSFVDAAFPEGNLIFREIAGKSTRPGSIRCSRNCRKRISRR